MERDPTTPQKAMWATLGEFSALAMTLALCVAIGLGAGYLIGRQLGYRDVGITIGSILGIAAAFYELFKTVRRMQGSFPTGKASDTRSKETPEKKG